MSKDYLDCFSCHWDGGRKPAGNPEEWGPDLGRAPPRLNPDWIVRWLGDPAKIAPGTKMPAFSAEAARTEYVDAGATLGRSLLVRLNCVGCHRIAGFPEGRRVGPHLGFQGSRVTREWLRDFLRSPGIIKPEYAIMGSGARMPDFRLSEREVDVLTDYIATKLVDPSRRCQQRHREQRHGASHRPILRSKAPADR